MRVEGYLDAAPSSPVLMFDIDPKKVGQIYHGVTVEPLDALRKSVAAHKTSLALLCVPAESAQRVAEQMIAAGIRGILNFAPVPLATPV